MANNNSEPDFKLALSVITTFGLGSIVVVVIGRLWTLSYFEHFGLSTGDLEFTINDFAFRSLEVWISLGLAALGLGLALRIKTLLGKAGSLILLSELLLAGLGMLFMLRGLEVLVAWQPGLARTGALGVINGIVLTLMILVVSDVWFNDKRQAHDPPGSRRLKNAANTWTRQQAKKTRLARLLAAWDHFALSWFRLIAGALAAAVVFVYLPSVTGTLAGIQARVDLQEGRLPVAILETFEDPLPDDIASDEDPTKSNLVRVVLVRGENTYVLDSMQCRTIGELKVNGEDKVSVRDTEGGGLTIIRRNTDVCKVFAIPTRRIKSIEYRSVNGNPPPNDTPSLAAQVGLREPFNATVSTRGASDDVHIACQGQELGSFRHTVWYEVTPPSEGVLLVRADSLTEDLSPVVGVWRDSGEAVPELDAAPGSGADRRACELETVTLPREAARSLGAPKDAQRVGTLANLQANETYLIGLGANGNKAGRTEGEFRVFIQFFPDGSFLATDVEPNVRPEIEFRSTLGRVTLELRHFGKDYALRSLPDCNMQTRANRHEFCVFVGEDLVRELLDDQGRAVTFSLESEDGFRVPFTLAQGDGGYPERTTLEAKGLLGAGTWRLSSGPFKILASLTIPALQPTLIISLESTRANARELSALAAESTPVDTRTLGPLAARRTGADTRELRALAAVLHPTQLQLEGSVVFVQGLDPATLGPTGDEKALTNDVAQRTLRGLFRALDVNINAVEQGQETAEEKLMLANAVAVVEKRLGDLGAEVTTNITSGPCPDICIRIFLIDLQPEVSAESDVLSEQQPPPNETAPSE